MFDGGKSITRAIGRVGPWKSRLFGALKQLERSESCLGPKKVETRKGNWNLKISLRNCDTNKKHFIMGWNWSLGRYHQFMKKSEFGNLLLQSLKLRAFFLPWTGIIKGTEAWDFQTLVFSWIISIHTLKQFPCFVWIQWVIGKFRFTFHVKNAESKNMILIVYPNFFSWKS